MTNDGFDAVRLAKRLDHMADKRTRYGTLDELVEEIQRVRAECPKWAKYPEAVWTDAYSDHLADNPPGEHNRRARFARVWVHDLLDQDSPEASELIRAWLRYRDAHGTDPRAA